MDCCGVCHTDLHVKNGDFGDKTGVILGHEGVGVVLQVGPGVNSLKPGDRASVAWFFEGCGHCDYCNSGHETLCRSVKKRRFTVDGGMAEECIVYRQLRGKSAGWPRLRGGQQYHLRRRPTYKAVKVSHIKPGQWIAIYGLGGLGNLALQYAKNVFMPKLSPSTSTRAAEAGRRDGRRPDHQLPQRRCGEGDSGEDRRRPCRGGHRRREAAFNSAVDAVRAGGRVVAVGLPPEAMSLDIPRLVLDGIEVVGSLVGTRQDLIEAFQFAAEGKVVPKVTLRPLGDIKRHL
ncbi:Alcohol dehydrogenase, propanol-preferring [Raoultella terrigena]|uniref:Alcohol dehydrogenase, propanol-preferring n=1 Tax=Raoultella terrigena TaxID=577 RepID=A0A4U9D071_RAOTE|nr:Alcohol dehydrogenase, propanol-preferring [Raoultella terrigena]